MRAVWIFVLPFLICVKTDTVEFTFSCKEGATFHHEGTCSSFYECREEDRPVLKYCPGNEEYNQKEGKCSPPEEANCVLPGKSAWAGEGQEGNEDKSVNHEEEVVRSREEEHERSQDDHHGWFEVEAKEESVEPKEEKSTDKSNEEEKSDDGWFSFFHVLEKETMREEGEEENASSGEERKDKEKQDSVSDSEISGETQQYSFWKRQVSQKRFRRSDLELPKDTEGGIAEGKVVDLSKMGSGIKENHDADENQDLPRYRRYAKKDESVEEKEDEESKSEDKINNENVEKIEGSQEAENVDKLKEQIQEDVEKEPEGRVETFTGDYPPIQITDENVQTDGSCGSLVISDPMLFQHSILPDLHNIHFDLHKEFPFVVETLLAGANPLPEEKHVEATEEEKSSETQESPKVEDVVEEEKKDVPEELLLEKAKEAEKKEETTPEEGKAEEKKAEEEKAEEEKTNEETEKKPEEESKK